MFRLTGRILWAVAFLLVMGASGRPRKLTPVEECVTSAPRSLDKTLTTALCEGARSFTAASAAAECAQAVGRAALNPRLAVSLCGAGPEHHAAGIAGGQCARAAQRRLTSLDQLPPTLRHDLCVGARSSRGIGSNGRSGSTTSSDKSDWAEAPVSCALAAGRVGRAANARGRKLDWLANAEHRVLLCQGAYGNSGGDSSAHGGSVGPVNAAMVDSTATAPVACAEALAGGASQGVGPGPGQVPVAMAVALCAQATSAAPGQCGAAASGLLGTNRAIAALDKASSSSSSSSMDYGEPLGESVEATDEGLADADSPGGLLAALCRSASPVAPVAPAQCMTHGATSSWPLAARVALCAGAGIGLETMEQTLYVATTNVAGNQTSNDTAGAIARNSVGSETLAELALIASEAPGQCVAGVKRVGGFSDAWTDTQLLALCRAAPPALREKAGTTARAHRGFHDSLNESDDMMRHIDVAAAVLQRWLAQHKAPVAAAQCANAAPPQMTPAEKVALCAGAPATDEAPLWAWTLSTGQPYRLGRFSTDVGRPVGGAASQTRGTSSSLPSTGSSAAAACAHKAGRFLRDGSSKAALCAGAKDLGPAECAAAAPFTMDPRLKVALCSGAPAGGAPGRCAATVRAASAESALTAFRDETNSGKSKSKDSSNSGETSSESSDEIATVPLPPSAAAAAGMDGGAPADYWWADWIVVSLCRGAASDAPSECFARAPSALDTEAVAAVRAGAGSAFANRQERRHHSPGSARDTILAWAQPEFATPPHSLRASLCADAEDNGPAECARAAANYTASGEGSMSNNGKRVLAPGTVVSLCHSATLQPVRPSNDNASSSSSSGSPPNEYSLVSFGPLSCAVAAASPPLARSLGLDLPTSTSTSQFPAPGASVPPVQLLRLCSGARSRGPADCAAAAPARLSADEKVALCRAMSEGESHWEGHSSSSNSNSREAPDDDDTAALWPALCAAAAPEDVASYKVVTTCQGASSLTPAHCLRAAPGSLTSADLLRCRSATAEATVVHVSVSEALVGRQTKAPSFTAADSTSFATTGAIMREDSPSQSIDAANKNIDAVNPESDFDGESFPSSTVAVEAVVVDQFHQPLQATVNLVHTQESRKSNGAADEEDGNAVSSGSSESGRSAVHNEEDSSIAEVAVGPGAPLAADGRSRFTSLQFAFQQSHEKDSAESPTEAHGGAESQKSNKSINRTSGSGKSTKATTSDNQGASTNVDNDESSRRGSSSTVETFSALLRLVLGGETLSHVHLSATTPTPSSPSETPLGYGASRSSLLSADAFRRAALSRAHDLTVAAAAVAADTASGVALGLRHDWECTWSFLGLGSSSAWSLNLVEESEMQHSEQVLYNSGTNNDQSSGSMAHMVGEVAGAAAVLPFRAGQGVGARLRLQLKHARGSSSRQAPIASEEEGLASSTTPRTDSSRQESDAASDGSSQSSEGQHETSRKGESAQDEQHKRRAKGKASSEDGRGEKAFDNVVGAVFVAMALGISARIAAFVWRTANCGGRSQFGVGDFGSDFYAPSGSSGSDSKGVGLGGATRAERNARAEELRMRQANARLTAAWVHDAALGLVAPGAAPGDGLAKRRKKFVLGVK